jgi:flagellar assembly protein FliH
MSRLHSQFIPSDQLGEVTGWKFGAVDQSSDRFAIKEREQVLLDGQTREKTLRDTAFAEGHSQGHNLGHSEGYAQGFAQGQAKATLEGQRQITAYIDTQATEISEAFAQLFESAASQISEQEQIIAQGVLELACDLARKVLRHELATKPDALQSVVREAVGLLITDSKAAVVRLHPADLEVLAEPLRKDFPGLQLTLAVDGSLTRGGCVVESAGTIIDGTLEKRWKRAVASLGLDYPLESEDDNE